MTTAEDLYARYPELLYPGDLRDIPTGWLGLVDRYLSVIAGAMQSSGYEVVDAAERSGGLDWTWTSPLSSMTAERHLLMDREDVLLELRSYHTCRECGRPGSGWTSAGKILTACEEHGVGERIVDRQPLVRRTPRGAISYDPARDQLVDFDTEEAR